MATCFYSLLDIYLLLTSLCTWCYSDSWGSKRPRQRRLGRAVGLHAQRRSCEVLVPARRSYYQSGWFKQKEGIYGPSYGAQRTSAVMTLVLDTAGGEQRSICGCGASRVLRDSLLP